MKKPQTDLPLEFKVLYWMSFFHGAVYDSLDVLDFMDMTKSTRPEVVKALTALINEGLIYRGQVERFERLHQTDQASFQTYGLTGKGMHVAEQIPAA